PQPKPSCQTLDRSNAATASRKSAPRSPKKTVTPKTPPPAAQNLFPVPKPPARAPAALQLSSSILPIVDLLPAPARLAPAARRIDSRNRSKKSISPLQTFFATRWTQELNASPNVLLPHRAARFETRPLLENNRHR